MTKVFSLLLRLISMANILDIRRRIRSVINTRQITKAMKMVSAAKLRRAQERALAARPYAQMLTNVLKSLVSRTEIYDPETGEPKHPLLAQRAGKSDSAARRHWRQGSGRGFQYQHSQGCVAFPRIQARKEHRDRSHWAQRAATSCAGAMPSPSRAAETPKSPSARRWSASTSAS